MHKTPRLLLSGAAVTAAAIALAGCTINIGVPTQGDHQSNMMSDEQNGSGFGQQYLMFADMMIPHHQQAIEMSTLAETQTTNPEIFELAAQIKAAQQPEIEQMQAWIDAAEQPIGGMDHSGHAMGGMLTLEQMQELAAATGPEFDRLYLEGMIQHHEGAIQMTRMIENSPNPEVKKLAEDIIRTQTAEIEQMREMLTSL